MKVGDAASGTETGRKVHLLLWHISGSAGSPWAPKDGTGQQRWEGAGAQPQLWHALNGQGGGELAGTQSGHTEGPAWAQKGEPVPEEQPPLAFSAANSL